MEKGGSADRQCTELYSAPANLFISLSNQFNKNNNLSDEKLKGVGLSLTVSTSWQMPWLSERVTPLAASWDLLCFWFADPQGLT